MNRKNPDPKFYTGFPPGFPDGKNQGVTLIELIIVIMVLGLMAAIVAPFAGPALTGSHRPMEDLNHAVQFSAEMSAVVSAYRNNPPDSVAAMDAFENSLAGIIDGTIASVEDTRMVMMQRNGTQYNETDCDDPNSLDCLLKVRLQSLENPGESLTYYFPYHRQ